MKPKKPGEKKGIKRTPERDIIPIERELEQISEPGATYSVARSEGIVTPEIMPVKRHKASTSGFASEIRRNRLIQAAINGECLKDVAIEAGYSPKTASAQASQILKSPQAKATFDKILEERGITDNRLADKIDGLLEGTRPIWAQWKGEFTDSRDIPALETQRRTLEMVLKLKGHLKDQTSVDINIGLMQMVVQAVQGKDGED